MIKLDLYIECQNKVFAFLLLVMLTLLGGTLRAQQSSGVAEQDSLALVAFYWATDGPNWISNQEGFGFDNLSTEWQDRYDGKFNHWFDGPVKDWFGVRVERRPIANSTDSIDRVTWLWPVIGRRTDGQNMLRGYVPQEIGFMTALEHFQVNGNDGFSWELLPDELYHPSLEHLDVEAAWFGGGLSDALRNCIGIRKLNTRYNYFDFMPNLDFLDEAAIRNLNGTQWFYNSRLSYFYMERIVDYFYTISPTPKEFGFEARDMFDVGDEVEIVAPVGSSIEMICNDAGEREEFITYQWFKDGLSKFGKKDKTYSIDNIKESDYGHYTTRISNEYVKAYDQNGNYGEVFTKGYHIVPSPIAPVIERGVVANSGQYVDVYFSKPMANSSFDQLQISSQSAVFTILNAEIRGRRNKIVRCYLDSPLKLNDAVSVSYDGAEIIDANGGVLLPIENLELDNRTRIAPTIIGAETALDGSSIILEFDQFIDGASLENADFAVNGENTYSLTSTTLAFGPVDVSISKKVILTLNEAVVDSAEVLHVAYLEGLVSGLFGGTVVPFEPLEVENKVSVDKTDITFVFEDGSESLDNVLLQGSWKVEPIQMWDDGSHGDDVAGDHQWSFQTSLVDDEYSWDVMSRATSTVYDTIQTIDSTTGNVVLTLISNELNMDSVLSANIVLNLSIADDIISGDSIYGIYNRDVSFTVRVSGSPDEVFLMGIDGDWSSGQLMTKVSEGVFSFTVPKKTAGDIMQYNYRRGNDWENVSPEPRNYIVINGDNQIQDEFGIFTSVDEQEFALFKLYPNPTFDGLVHLLDPDIFVELTLFNSMGQQVHLPKTQSQKVISLSHLPKGLYFLVGSTTDAKKYAARIIRQ